MSAMHTSDDYARALQRGLAPFVDAITEFNRNCVKEEPKQDATVVPQSGSSKTVPVVFISDDEEDKENFAVTRNIVETIPVNKETGSTNRNNIVKKEPQMSKKGIKKAPSRCVSRKSSLTTRQKVDEIVARGSNDEIHPRVLKQEIFVQSGDPASTTSSLLQERKTAENMKADFDALQARQEPEFRTIQDVLKERRSGVHSGCSTCRREGLRRADECIARGVIYNAYVSCCTHVPLGDFPEDIPPLPSSSEESREMMM